MRKLNSESLNGVSGNRWSQLMEMASSLVKQIEYERSETVLKAVYVELDKLDREFPKVIENHRKVDEGPGPMEYTIANLLYSAHKAGAYPEETPYCRKDVLQAYQIFKTIPFGPDMLMSLVNELFPQAVVCAEHLFFLQREMIRLFELPDNERPEAMRGTKLEDWQLPMDRLEKIRVMAVDLWKQMEDSYVNENRPQG